MARDLHDSAMARAELAFCVSLQTSHQHHNSAPPPVPPPYPTTLRGAPIAPYRHLPPITMLACRSFAAPARQCLRQANTSRWAPALAQVSATALRPQSDVNWSIRCMNANTNPLRRSHRDRMPPRPRIRSPTSREPRAAM